MSYYREQITKKSWQLLKQLANEYDFVLIGGWAVWLYTEQLKSKDIDIVIKLDELSKVRKNYDVFKNQRLKKYEFSEGEIDIDVYNNIEIINEFKVPKIELLIVLKLVAWVSRRGSAKGRKDFIDIVGLLDLKECQRNALIGWVKKAELYEGLRLLVKAIKGTVEIEELKLNKHYLSKQKERWLKLLVI